MNYKVGLLFMLAVNALLFMTQASIISLGQEYGFNSTQFYSLNNSVLKYAAESYTSDFNTTNMSNQLFTIKDSAYEDMPNTTTSVDTETGNIFTDTYQTAKEWLSSVGTYAVDVLTAVPNFLYIIGLPPAIAFSLGAFWYMIELFLLIMLILGK